MERAMQRARRQEDKQLRRETILRAALELLDERRFAEVKMIDIAQASGLAKGTIFLYFETKEVLFLELLEELLAEWLTEVNSELDNNKGRWNSSRVARIFAETLVKRDSLTRLLTIATSVLEQNTDVERIVTFKHRLIELLSDTGKRLEQRLEFLGPGEGAYLLLRIYALIVGVRQWTDPGATAKKALERPELAALSFQFEPELRSLILLVLTGLEKQPRSV